MPYLLTRPKKKKRYGAYYTPAAVSQVLSQWAIRSSKETILEPSFGGCGFLETSSSRLNELGARNPTRNLFGCDKDRRAFRYLATKIGILNVSRRFILDDFLAVKPTDFCIDRFDVVLGNPPYVSLHNMSIEQRAGARSVDKTAECPIDGKASLWAYFLIHSLQFLKEGGRCAWVLPSSFVNAGYSKNIRDAYSKKFKKVLVVALGERIFVSEGAEESTFVLLAEGFGRGPSAGSIGYYSAKTTNDLTQIIQNCDSPKTTNQKAVLLGISKEALDIYQSASQSNAVARLGELADIKIGIVTGCNKFFVLNQETSIAEKLPESALRPIFAKLSQSPGLSLRKTDLSRSQASNAKCLLLNTAHWRHRLKSVKRYLRKFPVEQRKKVLTFQKRPVWHRPDDGKTPDAFLSYMCDEGPKLMLNVALTTSTNTIHRIFFCERLPRSEQQAIALSLNSTLSQLSAEIEGRSYGAGVLKLEPNEARKLLLAIPTALTPAEISKLFTKVDRLVRNGESNKARRAVDQALLKPVFKQTYTEVIAVLERALKSCRRKRRGRQ